MRFTRSSLPALGAAIGGSAVGLAGLTAAVMYARRHRFPIPTPPHRSLLVDARTARYVELMEGVSRATLWGDPDRGAHGAFIRFAPGVRHPEHIHTNDIVLVVLSGAYLYYTPEQEVRVGGGSFFFIPGGLAHRSGGDDTDGALFYQESTGKFDLRVLE